MKVIMLMYDTLSRRYLESYGCDWTKTPNFRRLAQKTVTFDNAFAASLPCMPARREIHTGRYNFLHRSWGPMEPFDDSMPAILKHNGVYTHLVSDHFHYWEEGGANYHTKYSSWEISRGRQGDPWKGHVKDPLIPPHLEKRTNFINWRQEWVNRQYAHTLESMPQAVTFNLGMEFIEKNKDEDNWFLHLETFDPHEPFFSPKEFQDIYPHRYDDLFWDWPNGGSCKRQPHQVEHLRKLYAASISMCDYFLGKLLDQMDKYSLWDDTMLIVNTDHGYLLGEHDEWSKCLMPYYNEIAHIPLFIWDPRCGKRGQRRRSLVQTIDLPATILEFFGKQLPPDMQGQPLARTISADQPVRQAALFGGHGGHVNLTDGQYVYMRAPAHADDKPLYQYTLMPSHIRGAFRPGQLKLMEKAEPFKFTKGCPLMKIPSSEPGVGPYPDMAHYGTLLFNIEQDYAQLRPLKDPKVEQRMARQMVELMQANDAPREQYQRLGLQ